ncbi:MAG: hypothetical protein IH840_05800, partial [Candidatus Heimdallarchaeota archaeon]|nr:hypothetical protein [Candidatus Heimdallarchaeota archaeon]
MGSTSNDENSETTCGSVIIPVVSLDVVPSLDDAGLLDDVASPESVELDTIDVVNVSGIAPIAVRRSKGCLPIPSSVADPFIVSSEA